MELQREVHDMSERFHLRSRVEVALLQREYNKYLQIMVQCVRDSTRQRYVVSQKQCDAIQSSFPSLTLSLPLKFTVSSGTSVISKLFCSLNLLCECCPELLASKSSL